MATSRKTILFLGAAFLLFGLLTLIISPSTPPAMPPLGLGFISFTTNSTQERAAMYAVTNPTRRRISVFTAIPQSLANGAWPTNIVLSRRQGAAYVVGKERAQFSVAIPLNSEECRIPCVLGLHADQNRLD